ncbi:MAG: O-antigen polymerase [Phycisphaerales bacterium]
MQTVLAAYLFILAIAVLAYMVAGYLRGRDDMLSLRNFFLLGFVIFQLTSAAVALKTGITMPYGVQDLTATGSIYCVWVTSFLITFLVVYEMGLLSKPLARITPAIKMQPTEPFLWIASCCFLFLGLALRFVPIPLVGVLANMLGVALLAIAAGISAWIWARRPLNPAAVTLLITISSCAVVFALIGEFGRRSLVAVGGCVLWGAYYSRMRYEAQQTVIVRLAVLAVPLVVFVALFTAARGSLRNENADLKQQLSTVAAADAKTGILGLLDGQGAGVHSMWLIENFPDSYPYRPFLSSTIGYFLAYPIPRDGFWDEKPDSLSMDLPSLARLRNVNRDVLTIGPGIIGHAAADGGFPFVILYAFLFALILRYFDQVTRNNALQPLAVLPVGAALGQVLGFPRGEAGVFLFIYLFSATASYILMFVGAKMLERSGFFYPVGVNPFDPAQMAHTYDDYDQEHDDTHEDVDAHEHDPDADAA